MSSQVRSPKVTSIMANGGRDKVAADWLPQAKGGRERTTDRTTCSPVWHFTVSGKRLSFWDPSNVYVAQAAAPISDLAPARVCRNMLLVRCVSAPGPDLSAAMQALL